MVKRILFHPRTALVVALIVEAFLLVRGQPDFVASDPLWYADIANQLVNDPEQVFAAKETHPFVMRVGLTGSVALSYWLFGVSTFSSNLPVVLSGLAIVSIVYAAAPTVRAKMLGLVVAVFSMPLLRNATMLNVDLPCAALVAFSIYCLSRRRGGTMVVRRRTHSLRGVSRQRDCDLGGADWRVCGGL